MPVRLLLLLVSLYFTEALAQEQAEGWVFTRPPGWQISVDESTHLPVLTPPSGHASATFIASQLFSGTPEQWHDGLWSHLSEGMTVVQRPTSGLRGEFRVTWAAFKRADSSQAWLCLYSLVKEGRGEGVLFYADSEGPFRSYLTTVHKMVDTMTRAKTSSASRSPERSNIVPERAAASSNARQQAPPELQYQPPANFYKSAMHNPDQFFSNEVNASMQIYPFRAVSGNTLQLFQQTLLRDWIDPQYREGNPTGPPLFKKESIPGAQMVMTALFSAGDAGSPSPHLRILILSGDQAALVDVSANSAFSWQRAQSAIYASLGSMRVVAAPSLPAAVTASPGPAGKMIAGFYLGSKGQYKPNLNRPVGSGDWVASMHFYLFSADGRVYRSFDFTMLPGGDHSGFNYDKAQKEDPDNTGRYAVQGDQLIIQMTGYKPETITASVPKGGRLEIETTVYQRQ